MTHNETKTASNSAEAPGVDSRIVGRLCQTGMPRRTAMGLYKQLTSAELNAIAGATDAQLYGIVQDVRYKVAHRTRAKQLRALRAAKGSLPADVSEQDLADEPPAIKEEKS